MYFREYMSALESLLGTLVFMIRPQVSKEGLMSHLGQNNRLLGVRNIEYCQPLFLKNFSLEHYAILLISYEGT